MTWKVFFFCLPFIEGRIYIVETKGKGMLSVVKYLLTCHPASFLTFHFPSRTIMTLSQLLSRHFFQLNAEVGTRSMKVDTKIEKMKTKTSSEDYLISNYCKVINKIEFRHLQHSLNFHSASSGIHIMWWI